MWRGHGGCYVPLKKTQSTHQLDFLSSKPKESDKFKEKGLLFPKGTQVQTNQGPLGEFEPGFPISQEGHFNDWENVNFSSSGNLD